MKRAPLSLYIHIPFCSLKCAYCDFNSYAGLESLIRPYTDTLIREMCLWREAMRDYGVETVFFGGGTPSLMPLDELARIMDALHDSFDLVLEAEVSLEANPGTVDLPYLRGLLGLGVNRISLGVQSFHDNELAALDRIHSATEAREAYRMACEAGFARTNLDLIYGLAGQSMERWQYNLEQAIALEPDHLSLYALTIEEGTKLARDVERGLAPVPDPDVQAEMYEWSMERLATSGYRQYEISNWATPGQECRHNLVYWRNGEWLGLGAGAHSHLISPQEGREWRFANVYSPRQYVKWLGRASDLPAAGQEGLATRLRGMRHVSLLEEESREAAMADSAILALRLNEGLSLSHFGSRFDIDFETVYGSRLAEPLELGLLERVSGCLRLTDRGRLLANEVFVRLLPDGTA